MRGDTCCTHVVRHVSHTCKSTPLTSRWLAAWLECMHRDTPPSACRFACADRRTSWPYAYRHLELLDFSRKLRDEETSVFKDVELLKRRASKNVMLPKRPSDQSETSSNYGRAAYSTHSSLTINSSTTSFFEISRSILIARDSTTKLMFDQLSLFFESCQVLCDQNSTFLLILRLRNARFQILIFALSTILSRRAGYHTDTPNMGPSRRPFYFGNIHVQLGLQ
ncbi:hypothetical protein F2Q70_00024842 [Brassica cretica]|uniref:Uncharacterized protein n=1 Tax=Brassica cretica TaxID=69181 RepID=A0A8S9LIB7_BRACR|nr:hypothetical protein F2Q70_00024842 [Brassica cretica]